MAFVHWPLYFLIDETVVEADICGILGCIAVVDGAAAGPVDRGQTHGAGFAAGVDIAVRELEGVKLPACLADGNDLGVGGGVVVCGDAVGCARDDLAAFDDDGAKGPSSTAGDVVCGETDGLTHEPGIGLQTAHLSR